MPRVPICRKHPLTLQAVMHTEMFMKGVLTLTESVPPAATDSEKSLLKAVGSIINALIDGSSPRKDALCRHTRSVWILLIFPQRHCLRTWTNATRLLIVDQR